MWVTVELLHDPVEVGGRWEAGVGEPLLVAIGPEHRPGEVFRVVAELCDPHARPFRAGFAAPWRPAFPNGDAVAPGGHLASEVVAHVRRNAFGAAGLQATDRQVAQAGHAPSVRASVGSVGRTALITSDAPA